MKTNSSLVMRKIQELSIKIGIDLVKFGVINDERLYLHRENKDFLLEKGYRYFISLGSHISEAACELLFMHNDEGPMTYFHEHTKGRAIRLDNAGQELCMLLEQEGYRGFVVMGLGKGYRKGVPQIFSHIAGARISGMGVMGDSGLIITPEYGPRVRLSTILTDCSWPEEEKAPLEELCVHCGLCRKHCPSKAVHGGRFDPENPDRNFIDKPACETYRTSRLEKVNTRFCNLCMAVCPVAKKLKGKNLLHV